MERDSFLVKALERANQQQQELEELVSHTHTHTHTHTHNQFTELADTYAACCSWSKGVPCIYPWAL